MVDAPIVAGLWLWAWDDPSRAFRITSILASAVGWGLVAIAARGPFAVFDGRRATGVVADRWPMRSEADAVPGIDREPADRRVLRRHDHVPGKRDVADVVR